MPMRCYIEAMQNRHSINVILCTTMTLQERATLGTNFDYPAFDDEKDPAARRKLC
jgi:hypothetical protein